MKRPLIWSVLSAAILLVGILAIVLFQANNLILVCIIAGFLTAIAAVVEGILHRTESSLPLWYAASGILAAVGFGSLLFVEAGSFDVLGLLLPIVGVAALLWFGYQLAEHPERRPFDGLADLRRPTRSAGAPERD